MFKCTIESGVLFLSVIKPRDEYLQYIKKYSNKYKVGEALICAIIMKESGFNSQAGSYAGAVGLMQLMPDTARAYMTVNSTVDERLNPEVNIAAGTAHFKALMNTFSNNKIAAIAAYNAGSGNVMNWMNNYRNGTTTNLNPPYEGGYGGLNSGSPEGYKFKDKYRNWDGATVVGTAIPMSWNGSSKKWDTQTRDYVPKVLEYEKQYIAMGYSETPSSAIAITEINDANDEVESGKGTDVDTEDAALDEFTAEITPLILEEFYIWVRNFDDVKINTKTKEIYVENKPYKRTSSTTHPIPDGEYYYDKDSQKSYIKRIDTPDTFADTILDRMRKNVNYQKDLIPPWYKTAKEIDPNFKINPMEESITVISDGKQITYYKGEYFLLNGQYYVEDLSQGRYKYVKHLDGLQHDPHRMKTINFKQDYTVIIRKKTHYAATQGLKNKENYIKVFQINDFTNISTSHHVEQKGSATVNIRGATKVVVADKRDVVDNKGTKRWNSTFEDLVLSFNDIDKEFKGTWKGIEYNDIQRVREQKYNWAYAEKCDFEPMDEIHIFSKSPVKNKDGYYEFKKIFFGYIGTITKQFNATGNGPSISITAFDQVRLMELSRVIIKGGSPMTEEVGTAYRFDGVGNFIVEDDPLTYSDLNINDMDESTGEFARLLRQSIFYKDNAFAYTLLHELIIRHCIASGIPIDFLKNRIELINRAPFFSDPAGNAEISYSEFKDRYSICKEGANKLNIEFFCDEEGQIVLKIPTYNIGINRKKDNNLGIEAQVVYDKGITRRYVKVGDIEVDQNYSNYTYTPLKNETLWEIARRFFGDASMWTKVHALNKDVITAENGGNSYVPAGKEIRIKEGKNKEYEEQLYTDESYNNDGDFTLASLTDRYVPIIYPEEIIQFTFNDSESGIYTAAEVKIDIPYINGQQVPIPMNTRAVADFDLIRKFGLRVMPISGTTIPTDGASAEVYAGLMIMRSLAMRYTGSLNMIENPNIRIGMPIRLFLYDEHIFTELYKVDRNNDFSMAQAIFYVDGITRNIDVRGVSTMSLTLKAGRMVGMPSVFDKATELYRYFHDDILIDGGTQEVSVVVQNAKTVETKESPATKYQNYIIQSGDTISIITKKFYGNKSDYAQKKFDYQKKITELNKKTSNGKNGYVDFTKALPAGVPIKIPTDVNSIYTVKSGDNIGSIVQKVYSGNLSYTNAITPYINALVAKNESKAEANYKDGQSFDGKKIEVGQILESPIDSSKKYTVKQGDNLGGILYRLYSGNKQYLKDLSPFMYEIEKINSQTRYNKQPFNKNKLYANMQIVLPYVPNVTTTLVFSNVTKNSVKLSWTTSKSTVKIAKYQIFMNGKLKTSTTKKEITIEGLKPNTDYSFVVKALDTKDNASTKSNAVYIKTENEG